MNRVPQVTIIIRPGALKHAKNEIVRVAMIASRGVISDAAKLLGIHRQTMQRYLRAMKKGTKKR